MKSFTFSSFPLGTSDDDEEERDERYERRSFLRVWNVDGAVARKVSILWAFFMYVGQATKDIIAIPRPSSPPVPRLEKR